MSRDLVRRLTQVLSCMQRVRRGSAVLERISCVDVVGGHELDKCGLSRFDALTPFRVLVRTGGAEGGLLHNGLEILGLPANVTLDRAWETALLVTDGCLMRADVRYIGTWWG